LKAQKLKMWKGKIFDFAKHNFNYWRCCLRNSGGIRHASVGFGGDIGTGAAVGGQVTVGVTDNGINSGGVSTGKFGGGGGFSVGIDVCWTDLKCKTCGKK
jgi:hypothetical protein